MTFEQLSIFIAVAEREHLTRAANAIGLTPSAVSASIKTLEAFYGVRLFERVGRGIELTQDGRLFLVEAKATLARVRAAEQVLTELGGMKRGTLDISASQTVASYWLPPLLMRFHASYPHVDIRLTVGNTRTVTQSVVDGLCEMGFIEGAVEAPVLAMTPIAEDQLVVVVPARHPLAALQNLTLEQIVRETTWVMREEGSGTRSEFEGALKDQGIDPLSLKVALTFPSNEAVLSAVRYGHCAAALSSFAVMSFVRSGELKVLDIPLRRRSFVELRHRERRRSLAAGTLLAICREHGGAY